MNRFSRRQFMAVTGVAIAAGAAGGLVWWQKRRTDEHAGHDMQAMPSAAEAGAFTTPLRLPGTDGLFGVLDVPVPLTIVGKTIRHPILPGKPVPLLAYEVEHDGKTFLNPVLRVRNGAALRVKFWNALDETSIIHWHGLHVDSNNDGHPVGLGKRFGAQLAALDGDAGARDIIAAHKCELVLVECDDPGVLYDVDRKSDLAT